MNRTQIFVALLDEGVDVWRPVEAERLSGDLFRIAPQPYDAEIERWAFPPGAVVRCDLLELSGQRVLAAREAVRQAAE